MDGVSGLNVISPLFTALNDVGSISAKYNTVHPLNNL